MSIAKLPIFIPDIIEIIQHDRLKFSPLQYLAFFPVELFCVFSFVQTEDISERNLQVQKTWFH